MQFGALLVIAAACAAAAAAEPLALASLLQPATPAGFFRDVYTLRPARFAAQVDTTNNTNRDVPDISGQSIIAQALPAAAAASARLHALLPAADLSRIHASFDRAGLLSRGVQVRWKKRERRY